MQRQLGGKSGGDIGKVSGAGRCSPTVIASTLTTCLPASVVCGLMLLSYDEINNLEFNAEYKEKFR